MYQRFKQEITAAEFRKALKAIGIDIPDDSVALGAAFGNDAVAIQWSVPVAEKKEAGSQESLSENDSTENEDAS